MNIVFVEDVLGRSKVTTTDERDFAVENSRKSPQSACWPPTAPGRAS